MLNNQFSILSKGSIEMNIDYYLLNLPAGRQVLKQYKFPKSTTLIQNGPLPFTASSTHRSYFLPLLHFY